MSRLVAVALIVITVVWVGAAAVPVTFLMLLAPQMQSAAGSTCFGGALVSGADTEVASGQLQADTLTPVQQGHVQTILAVGVRRGLPEQALVIALATAAQESTFLMYANDGKGSDLRADQRGVGRSLDFPHDAVGTDHGSVNFFQQQYPWWGDLPELMDPATAAGKFYDALARVDGWQGMRVAEAAQAVQRSAYPEAYAKWEPLARELVASLAGTVSAGAGDGVGGALPGSLCPAGTPIVVPQGQWVIPVVGNYRVTSRYGYRDDPLGRGSRLHSGVDLAAPSGTPLVSMSGGTVQTAGWVEGYGNLVVIRSTGASGEMDVHYAHLCPGCVDVSVGDVIAAGAPIGAVGSTGPSTGPHLHLAIRIGGQMVDPEPVMQSYGLTVS